MIKTQVKIRNKVLGQKNAHIVFTVKRKPKPICDLIFELKTLLTTVDAQPDQHASATGKNFQSESLCTTLATKPQTLAVQGSNIGSLTVTEHYSSTMDRLLATIVRVRNL